VVCSPESLSLCVFFWGRVGMGKRETRQGAAPTGLVIQRWTEGTIWREPLGSHSRTLCGSSRTPGGYPLRFSHLADTVIVHRRSPPFPALGSLNTEPRLKRNEKMNPGRFRVRGSLPGAPGLWETYPGGNGRGRRPGCEARWRPGKSRSPNIPPRRRQESLSVAIRPLAGQGDLYE
jgi:hypothetical protein